MTEFYNRTVDMDKRRILRNNPTVHESMLWGRLNGKQMNGLKFRRQYSVSPYILDFYCPAAKLAIELDGAVHRAGDQHQYDLERDEYISAFGIHTIRFTNDDIERDIESVLSTQCRPFSKTSY